MPSGMTKHENIAKALKARLSELTTRVGEIDSELRKPLSADLEEQATDLENQEALEAIEDSEIHEIHQIREALKRISEGTYGICAHCGEDIDPKRLEALIGAKVVRHGERGNEVLRHGRPLKSFKEESWPAMPQVRRDEHTPLDHRQRRVVDAAGSGARSPLRGRPRRDGAREFRCL